MSFSLYEYLTGRLFTLWFDTRNPVFRDHIIRLGRMYRGGPVFREVFPKLP